MKKIFIPFLCFCILFAFYACESSSVTPSAEYFPLQVGNYWKVSDTDYIEVTGIKDIGGQEYFEFTSKDPFGTSQMYLRVDKDLNLIQTYANSRHSRILANLRLKKGQKMEDQLEKGTVIERNNQKIVFRYLCMPCSQANATFDVIFAKDKGLLSRNLFFAGLTSGNPTFKEIRINGKVYRM
jgi:hypothetical protein